MSSETPTKNAQTLQTLNFIGFCFFGGQFWPAWIRIRIPNLDSLTQLNPDPKKP